MELYQLIAQLNNSNPATSFTIRYLPENFQGVKISQKFNFTNPIGYTPKFSVETMKIISTDKAQIDTVFDTYGLQSNVTIQIYKLNVAGTGYDLLSTFAIDFESYEKYDYYSEFALKSISVIDYYNNIKSVETQVNLVNNVFLPNTQKYINYVSLKSIQFSPYYGSDRTYFAVDFEANNDSKIYNGDSSLSAATPNSSNFDTEVYHFVKGIDTSLINISSSGTMTFNVSTANGLDVRVLLMVVEGGNSSILYTFYEGEGLTTGDYNVDFFNTKLALPNRTLADGSQLFVLFDLTPVLSRSNPLPSIYDYNFTPDGNLFLDIKVPTDLKIVGNATVSYVPVNSILNNMFDNKLTIKNSSLQYYGLTSAMQLLAKTSYANYKPSDLLRDLCIATGSIVNFKNDGTVIMDAISAYFNNLLQISNAVEIVYFKDLSIKYNKDFNFSGVSVGCSKNDYNVYSYLIDWNKILTFNQQGRNATEVLKLTPEKIRFDFSGILDYFYKSSQQSDNTSDDNFIFKTDFAKVAGAPSDINLYDHFTPRGILQNWIKFLAFCFQNFGLDTLKISSNGGTVDNLTINGVNQMDDVKLMETPRILPIEYDFTCLIDSVDFTEKILKINNNGDIVYLFVIDSETTDKLSEQKVKGLKIQF